MAALAIILSTSKLSAIILDFAASTVSFPARNSATIKADSLAAPSVILEIIGSISSNWPMNSLLKTPVATICFFNASISAFDCIANVAVIECHLAASLATTPVDAPPTLVNPGTFGKRSCI